MREDGWQTWHDELVGGVGLTAGVHTLRVETQTGGFNLNAIEFRASAGLPAPTLSGPGGTRFVNEPLDLTWPDVAGAPIYQLLEATDAGFNNVIAQYWPSASHETVVPTTTGGHHYKVRAWTIPPEQGGSPSPWSNTLSYGISE